MAGITKLWKRPRGGSLDHPIGQMPVYDGDSVMYFMFEGVAAVTASRTSVLALPHITMKALLAWRWLAPGNSIMRRQ